ncbi:hypothetical protein RRG08_053244 [Elysia crispata]|uniref:Uncharacterized protein n=1 Tax=Elysia crispata TaxID=231223 RepID=A0AAE1E291_9GAST|nr:hypothetical protein RRG08_053244 [Elysia crispata]
MTVAFLVLERSSLYYICPLWFDPRVPVSTQEVQTMTVAFLVLERSSLYYICQGARCIISVLSGLIQESQSLHRKSRP